MQLYANALAVCYLPFDEDYGYVTLEGMLSGKPVLVTNDSGGAAELIEHDRDGLVVEPGSESDRGLAGSALRGSRSRARAWAKRATRNLPAMKLSWENVVEKIISAAG